MEDSTLAGGSPGKLMKTSKNFIIVFRKGDKLIEVNINEIIMDPCNRDGEGVKIDEVLTKAEKIEAQGVGVRMYICMYMCAGMRACVRTCTLGWWQ